MIARLATAVTVALPMAAAAVVGIAAFLPADAAPRTVEIGIADAAPESTRNTIDAMIRELERMGR